MTALLNPRTWLAAAVVALLIATHWAAWRQGGAGARAEFAQYKLDSAHQSELQRIANRDRSRIAETGEGDRIVYRDRVITKTITEVRHATAPLADCPLPSPAVRVLNDASRCAREGRSPTCIADAPLPDAR